LTGLPWYTLFFSSSDLAHRLLGRLKGKKQQNFFTYNKGFGEFIGERQVFVLFLVES